MYLTQHPLETYRKWINNIQLDEITNIIDSIENDDGIYQSNQAIIIPAIIGSEIKKKITKKQTNVWFFDLSDEGSDIAAVGFDKFVNQYGYLVQENKCCIVKGKLDQRDDDSWQIICNEVIMFPRSNEEIDAFLKVVKPVERKQQQYHQNQQNIQVKNPQSEVYKHGIHICLDTLEQAEREIYPMIDAMPGSYPVFMYFRNETINGKPMAGRYPRTINIDSPILRELVEKVGMSNVKWF